MNTYILLDAANTFSRGRHITRGSLEDRLGMCLHTMLASIRKAWNDFDGTHVVIALEGRSWRKDYYPPYKRQRREARDAQSPKEAAEDRAFWDTFDLFKEFISEQTNCTVLQNAQLEADDLIAGWVWSHPNDHHVIISTDGDFAQLISENVSQYNGVTGVTTRITGYYDDRGREVVDKKTKQTKGAPNPEWLLFEKCIRGDASDNVFSAYPGVREKGTKNKVGLREAFEDRNSKGWAWNNLLLQKWVDHEGVEHRVLDDYERNRVLCDLNHQPENIKAIINQTIADATLDPKSMPQVGSKLMKFCGRHDLIKISEQASSYAEPLSATYGKS